MQKKIFYNFLFIFLITTSSLANEIIAGYPKVIDGDTVHINASKIRLNGIDAPEREQICSKFNAEYNCGITTTQALTEKINNQIISCKLQPSKDRYGRYIGVCFLENLDLNKWMVRNGYAVAYRRYSKDYIEDEEYAKKNKLGIWQGNFLNSIKFPGNK